MRWLHYLTDVDSVSFIGFPPTSQGSLACSRSITADGAVVEHTQLCTSGTYSSSVHFFASDQPFWNRTTDSCSDGKERKNSDGSRLQGTGESIHSCTYHRSNPQQRPFRSNRFLSNPSLNHLLLSLSFSLFPPPVKRKKETSWVPSNTSDLPQEVLAWTAEAWSGKGAKELQGAISSMSHSKWPPRCMTSPSNSLNSCFCKQPASQSMPRYPTNIKGPCVWYLQEGTSA